VEIIDFSTLFQKRGGYCLPVLVELRKGESKWRFTGNDKDVTFEGKLYRAVPMHYSQPTSNDGILSGGSLEIDFDINDGVNEFMRWFDEADDKAEIEITAVINEQGEIRKISRITRRHGTISFNGQKIVWNFGEESRMNMQINCYIFDTDALTG
jgi:hypothetical protein